MRPFCGRYTEKIRKMENVYLRSEKLSRAKQLGFEYPRRKIEELAYEQE